MEEEEEEEEEDEKEEIFRNQPLKLVFSPHTSMTLSSAPLPQQTFNTFVDISVKPIVGNHKIEKLPKIEFQGRQLATADRKQQDAVLIKIYHALASNTTSEEK